MYNVKKMKLTVRLDKLFPAHELLSAQTATAIFGESEEIDTDSFDNPWTGIVNGSPFHVHFISQHSHLFRFILKK